MDVLVLCCVALDLCVCVTYFEPWTLCRLAVGESVAVLKLSCLPLYVRVYT
jgi:hypothetical protein